MEFRKNRHTHPWKRIETPEMDRQIYGRLIIDKAGKHIQLKRIVSSINAAWNAGQPQAEGCNWTIQYTIHKGKLKMDENLM